MHIENIIKTEVSQFLLEEQNRYYENLIIEGVLNETITWDEIKGYLNKISDKNKLLNKVIKKFNSVSNTSLKKYLVLIALTILTQGSISINSDRVIDSKEQKTIERVANNVSEKDSISHEILMGELKIALKSMRENKIKSFNTSDVGKDFIKEHEGFSTKAYALGDNMITIGYGHAERIGDSKFSVGDEITQEEANELFEKDLNVAENGVKRILLRMLEKNPSIDVSQSMFDAMVSMAFNMGVRGLATTDFIETLSTTADPLKSAELIKTSRIGSWSGLKNRREKEYKLFLSDISGRDDLHNMNV